MKKLHLYVLKAFVGPWLITFLLCVFLLLMQFLWRYVEDLVGKGLEFSVIMEFMFYTSFSLVPLALPLSGLLASILAMGKLGEKNELFAMKSGGLSLYKIMFPLVIFNIFVSFGAFFFANNVMPYTNLKMRTLLFGIQQQRPEVVVQNGVFVEPVDDIFLKVESKSHKNNDLNGVLIYDHRNGSTPNNVTIAESGNIMMTEDNTLMVLELRDGTRHEDVKGKKYQHQRSKFERQVTYLELDVAGIDKSNEDFFKGGYEMLDNEQLGYTIDSISKELTNREEEICGNYKRFQIYKGLNEVYRDPKNKTWKAHTAYILRSNDSLIACKASIDTILNNIDKRKKAELLNYSLNYARSAKGYIDIVSDEITGTQRWIVKHKMEWFRKYALSTACLLFCFIGIPLGALIRKGGFGLSVVVSVVIFLLYYIITTTVESTIKEMVTPVGIGMWLSTLLLLPIGAYLVIAVANDSLRINPRFMTKLVNLFKFRRKKREETE